AAKRLRGISLILQLADGTPIDGSDALFRPADLVDFDLDGQFDLAWEKFSKAGYSPTKSRDQALANLKKGRVVNDAADAVIAATITERELADLVRDAEAIAPTRTGEAGPLAVVGALTLNGEEIVFPDDAKPFEVKLVPREYATTPSAHGV